MKRLMIPMLVLLLIGVTSAVMLLQSCSDTNNDCPPRENPTLEALFPHHGNYYQLFVRSFADSNGDGVGDFNGIRENLDYFETLGIDGLWLMPIHPSPSKHGYDVIDYYAVNPEYGTMEDFEKLLDEARARGITIIIDYVLNHSSDQHPWFEAFLNGEAGYENFYRRIDQDDDRFGNTGSWGQTIWHSAGDGTYYAGYFGGYMPDLNWSNPDVQDEMLDVAKYWMEKGVGGFRLDAALHLQASATVPSYYNAFDETLNELAYFDFRLKEAYPDAYIVGEIWNNFDVYNQFYRSLDSPLHFDFGHHVVQTINAGHNDSYASRLVTWHQEAINKAKEHNRTAVEAPFLRNHDQNRIASSSAPGTPNLGNDFDKLRLAAEMLLTAPGTPFLYYGEELGMMGEAHGAAPIWDESIRLPMLFDNEYRTTWPMDDWGYHDPYNGDVDSVSVQQADEDSLYNVYSRLLNLRKDSLAMRYGSIVEYDDNDRFLQGFYRVLDIDDIHDVVLVLHNPSRDIIPLFDAGIAPDDILYYSEGVFESVLAPRTTLIIQVDAESSGLVSNDE